MVSLSTPIGKGNDRGSSEFEDRSNAELHSEIEDATEAFFETELDEEDGQAELFRLAMNISERYGELAQRDQGPDDGSFSKKQTRWEQVAELVLDGTDPSEMLKSGNDGGTDVDISEFRVGIPDTTFDDIGGYAEVKARLLKKGIMPAEWRDFIQGKLNRSVLNGVVFHGPPGTGKTEMSEAYAGELHARLDRDVTVFKIKPNQLKRGIRGESGKLLRSLFAAAKREQPAVIIFEEIDTLIQDRSAGNLQKMQADRDLVNSFLDEVTEIDTEEVTCLGTTNRFDALDEAAIRDKRLETLEMGLPNASARAKIFRIHLQLALEQHIDMEDISVEELAAQTKGVTGATIAKIVDEAILTMGLEFKRGNRQRAIVRQADIESIIQQ
jgi:SpoVK/Ycf46/Vps4 family AAA+-type ATPase